jgi:hypothetical protein
MERIVIDHEHLTTPGHLTRTQSSSQLSDLAEYVHNQLVRTLPNRNALAAALFVAEILGRLAMRQNRKRMSRTV